jgi:hypothetical protein
VKWKLFMRKMSVSAPRVTVRSAMPNWLRAVLGFVVLAAAAAAGVATYEYGRQFAGPDRRDLQADIERLNFRVRELTAERDRFAALAAAHDSQLKVERAAQEQLLKQAADLETEASRLREDLAFFESLLPAAAGAPKGTGVVIRSFRVQPADDAANVMRYRLLVQQQGKPERDFVGGVQLTVSFLQGGRPFTLTVPAPNAPDDPALGLSFRHYQRVEGRFTLPAGAVARSVQVRIVANGEVRIQQAFTL